MKEVKPEDALSEGSVFIFLIPTSYCIVGFYKGKVSALFLAPQSLVSLCLYSTVTSPLAADSTID